MITRWTSHFLLGLLLTAGTVSLTAQTWTVPHKIREIYVDGVLEEWDGIPQLLLAPGESESEGNFEKDDVSVVLKAVWDDRALYLAVEWRDDVWDLRQIRRRDSVYLTANRQRRDRMYFFDYFKFMLHQLNYNYLIWFSPRANDEGPFYWQRLLRGAQSMEAAVGLPVIAPREEDGVVRMELLFDWKKIKLNPKKLIKKGMPLTLAVADADAPDQILETKAGNLSWLEWQGILRLAKK